MSGLLAPLLGAEVLPSQTIERLNVYLELLLRWNARVNLTAVRDPEQIVTRHFGESLFAARLLFPEPASLPLTLADVGSGAGFPGIPMKLLAPEIQPTLIESQNKKAVFLREVIRSLHIAQAEVFCGRAEQWGRTADVVTLRAVEQFQRVLPVAAALVAPAGRLCLLIGSRQFEAARELTSMEWVSPVSIPNSDNRVVAIGQNI